MRSVVRCACFLIAGCAASAQAGPPQRQPPGQQQPDLRSPRYELRLPGPVVERRQSPSELDDVMSELPLIAFESGDDDGRERGFSFGVKPGKGVKAIGRLRF